MDLGLVNVFIGANGSGKSNFLEAIGVLGAAAHGRVDDEALLRRGVRPGLPVLYRSSFKGTRISNEIRFWAANKTARYAVGLYNPQRAPERAWQFKTERLTEAGRDLVGRSPATRLRLDPASGYTALKAVELPGGSAAGRLLRDLREFAIFSPDTATLRGLDTDPQSRSPVGLSGGGLAQAVDAMFRTRKMLGQLYGNIYDSTLALIDWSNGLGSSAPEDVPVSQSIPQPTQVLRFRDRFMADNRNYLSGYDASEGALYVLFLTVLVHHAETPSVVAVDNFDHALNPRLARALTRKVCDWMVDRGDRQILLTSHNPLVLDGLPLRNSAIRLFTVERSNRGKTVVRRVVVDEALLRSADEGIPLSQQWVMGTFGGVPSSI